MEAQLFILLFVILPATDGAGSHPDRPRIDKIKKYAKIKMCHPSQAIVIFFDFLCHQYTALTQKFWVVSSGHINHFFRDTV